MSASAHAIAAAGLDHAPRRKAPPTETMIDSGFDPDAFLRRNAAGEYLKSRYKFGTASALAKLAMTGDGPLFYKSGSRVALYRVRDLDDWALGKLGAPRRSTSDISKK